MKRLWIIALLLFACENSDVTRCEVFTSETTGQTYIECPDGNSYPNTAEYEIGESVYVTTTFEGEEE